MTLRDDTLAALAPDGALAQAIANFVPRAAQERMAQAVADAIDDRATLIAEAGTGTGKTYAYLVPALLSGLRVIVSTGTRALQDQLFHRDLPRVRDALGVRLKTALLKGRSNYLCHYRIDRARHEGRYASRELVAQLVQIHAFAGRSTAGDVAEIDFVPEDSPLWPQVTSTAENCLGSECPHYSECFVVKARQAAQEADLVVVNHHLLFADLALKREGFGEILPGAHAFVLDEAHQLPELASQFFSLTVSARQMQELARDTIAETASVTGALEVLQPPSRGLEQAVRELRLELERYPLRGALAGVLAHEEGVHALDTLRDALLALSAALAPMVERSVGLAACSERADEALDRVQRLLAAGDGARRAQTRDHAWPQNAIQSGGRFHGEQRSDEDAQAGGDPHADDEARTGTEVRWYEVTQRGFSLNLTPLDVSSPLREFRERSRAAWIYTSATLAVAGDFHHLAVQLGLDEPRTLLEPSPFDYQSQALAYLPKGLPEPAARNYVDAVVHTVLPVLDASKGRAFLLFTSHRALREAAEILAARRDFPLYVQGTQPRHRLLDEFRHSGNGVLLGAASFWEGVDVAGDALSVVVIDKLPFAAPDDPVLEARLEAVRRNGGNPFRDWQLPTAVIALKQGAGRLIRTHGDRGVLVLCDPRLVAKAYGRLFLDSLPPLPRTRELADVQDFFAPVEWPG